ncbi:MAG: hypothetical protein QOF51_567 [Chloroflexota bacterium]|nr:hypothetical protein [Chloroflexota bacterium]
MVGLREPVVVTEPDVEPVRALERLLSEAPGEAVCLVGPSGERLPLPTPVRELLAQIVHQLGEGDAVTVEPIHPDLTTQQAADLLNVSRPYFVKLLAQGELPFYMVGSHHRVNRDALLTYRGRRHARRLEAIAEMAREAQEMGLYE